MAHYIDSDKLKAKIKRELKRLEPYNKETLEGVPFTMGHALGQKDAYNELLPLIESMEREPEPGDFYTEDGRLIAKHPNRR